MACLRRPAHKQRHHESEINPVEGNPNETILSYPTQRLRHFVTASFELCAGSIPVVVLPSASLMSTGSGKKYDQITFWEIWTNKANSQAEHN